MADHLEGLNQQQRSAVEHTGGPLLIIAGAGSGKTNTLAHRVAHLMVGGADPRRILLLTFSRRAAQEMSRRAERIVQRALPRAGSLRWSGTFHAMANRLLRMHSDVVGLDPSFTVLDRSDSADLLDIIRNRQGLARKARRFPRKGTCLAIYSRVVNTQHSLQQVLDRAYPWCAEWGDELKALFAAYVVEKQERHTLDYDDLLLYWYYLVQEPSIAAELGGRFDHILVDEYQDTNALQAGILFALKPDGAGLTVVGDDAQSIYSFRAATVRNILDFPERFQPPATVITLEQNYRSTRPILAAANRVIELAPERFTKNLTTERVSSQRPLLVTTEDETSQVDYVVDSVLRHREQGIDLKRQAVLFRTAHHSDQLEVELGRRNIPFVKFGGLKFLEAAHVKDVLCVLRWAENPRDVVAAFRGLQLLPGIGPAIAQRAVDHVQAAGWELTCLDSFSPPAGAADAWPAFVSLVVQLRRADGWAGQLGRVRLWYQPHLERIYDAPGPRAGDLEQLELIADQFPSRERFLSELTLDPPSKSGDEAGPPHLDEDYLILSTIHSAKGQEWDAVYVINAADGCIPSDMATGTPEEIEEERRLLYVAMTRARDSLTVIHPQRFFTHGQHRHGDRHVYAPVSRFLPDSVCQAFERVGHARSRDDGYQTGPMVSRVDVATKLLSLWQSK